MGPSAVEAENPFTTCDAAGQHSMATLDMLASSFKVLSGQGGGPLISWPQVLEFLCPMHDALQQ